VDPEDPFDMLRRLKLGREETCQRLITMLILDAPYPRWNTQSVPSSKGLEFLQLLDAQSFGASLVTDPAVFVDELDLPRRHEHERGSAPDWAVLTADRLWMIELKTERGSHRADQIPGYFELGRHYHPDKAIDLTYLTGVLSKPAPTLGPGMRYAHLHWHDVVPLVRSVWEGSETTFHTRAVEVLDLVLSGLDGSWQDWRDTHVGSRAPVQTVEPVAAAIELAELTAADHAQRALEHEEKTLEDLQTLRLEVSEVLRGSAEQGLRHVRPWLWNHATSTGVALTASGAKTGYELRLSWYRSS
jgi:hypothetical protein